MEGGGIVVMLLSTLTSLTKLYDLTMDCHARLRTESHQEVVGAPTRLPSTCPSPLPLPAGAPTKGAQKWGRQVFSLAGPESS